MPPPLLSKLETSSIQICSGVAAYMVFGEGKIRMPWGRSNVAVMPCPPKENHACHIKVTHCDPYIQLSISPALSSSRSVFSDLSLSIRAGVSIDSMNDDKVAIIVPKMSPVLPESPSNRILPLGLQNEASHPAPTYANRVVATLVKKVVAEFLGTFLLIFTLLSALIMNEIHGSVLGLLSVAAAAGLVVVVIVTSIVHVSGSHLNPAVSIAMAVFGYLSPAHLVPYMVAQFLGSIGASFVAKAIYHPSNAGATIATVPALGAAEAFFIEFITTFVLLFVITALATDPKAVKELIAVGAGVAVMMNALISAELTGASMNPARTLGPAIATGTYTKIWVYLFAPPLGAIAGTGAYVILK